MVELQNLTASQARPLFDPMIDVYQAVFSQPPYHESLPDFLNFVGRLSFHARQPGFRCVIARSQPDRALVGFVYGFPGKTGSWLYNQAAPRLDEATRQCYLADFFEFAELAVLPAWQGQGLGRRLHDALLAEVHQRTAVLATPVVETNAHHLYVKHGWVTLTRGIQLPGTRLEFEIMGKTLA